MKKTNKIVLLSININCTLFLIFVLSLHYQNEKIDTSQTEPLTNFEASFAEKEVLEGDTKRRQLIYE